MISMIKYGCLMQLPEGKQPGFYAQIVKAIAASVALFDRDKELLITNSAEERQAVQHILNKYKVTCEQMELLLVPEHARLSPLFSDYGFHSKFGNSYLYADTAALFTLEAAGQEQTVQQLEEWLLAVFTAEEQQVYAIGREHRELAEATAKTYGGQAAFINSPV